MESNIIISMDLSCPAAAVRDMSERETVPNATAKIPIGR